MYDYDTITFDDIAGLLCAMVCGIALAGSMLLLLI
jgi:hypothetical protein